MEYKILVFDDGLAVAKLVKSILVNEPFDVIEGDIAQSYSVQCKKHQADLVLLDFNVAIDKDGYEISTQIKSDINSVKIVLVFDTFDQPDINRIQSSGVDDYIYRPFDGEKLIKTCRHLVGLETTRITKIKDVAVEKQTEKSKEEIEKEVSGWNIMIPDIINAHSEFAEESSDFDNNLVPGIIEKQNTPSNNDRRSGPAYPSSSDLAFPDEPTRTEHTMVVSAESLVKENNDEKTELVDLTKIAAAQKDLLGKLKEQIQDEVEDDFWSAEESDVIPAEMSQERILGQGKQAVQHQVEDIFNKVEQTALKQEIMATIRDQMLQDFKKEILEELRSEIITNLTPADRNKIIEDLKANVIKTMKEKLYEELFAKLSKEIHHEIWHKLKEELFASGSGYLEEKISQHFIRDVVPMLRADVPALTQEMIQAELIRIRRLIEGQ
jgi:CheY-like chemotaxis protein